MKLISALIMLLAAPALAAVETGAKLADFTATASNGETIKLSSFAGKNVVLEWTNHGCPFVKKFYSSGTMQQLQKDATAKGVVWLRVISSAEGKQGHLTPEAAEAKAVEQGAAATYTLLDASGELGKMFAAKTTPHMFVINAQGVLAYQGAIDSKPSPNADDIADATNYVTAALAALAEGKTPAVTQTKPYGCGVKYAH